MDNLNKKLLNGTAIYFVGNALASLLSLMVLRFITGRIASDEYGLYNLIVTVSNLVTPFVTLQIADAVFKFLIKAKTEDERKNVFSASITVFIFSFIVIIAGVSLINAFFVKIPHPALVAGYFISTNFYALYHRIVRAFGRNKVYVLCNLTRTFMVLVMQITLISCFNWGVAALLFATICADIIFAMLAETQVHAFRLWSVKSVKFSVFKSMLKFSAPLMPNTALWWLTSSINTLIISDKCGLEATGIYTVANKFSAILSLVTAVFVMSWQELAVAEYGKKNFKSFFTNTFNMYIVIVITAIVILIPFMKTVFPVLIDASYYESIKYAPFLLIVSGMSALSGFLAQIFTAQGTTCRNLWTTLVGMGFNIVIVFACVDIIGLWAAVFGSMTAYAVIMILRLLLVSNEFEYKIKFINISISLIMLACSIVIYMNFATVINVIWFVLMMIVSFFLNFRFIKDIFFILALKKS